MKQRTRRSAAIATTVALMAAMACAGNPRPGTYTRLLITGSEIRDDGYRSAYEALTHHRQLIVLEGEISFRGGNDNPWTRDGSGRVQPRGRMSQTYYVPLLVVDGDFNQNDAVTTLRRIPAEEIVSIRLYHQSMVPPRYRRPGAEGGVIEVNTR
ncbi:MAG: hypothetical protein F4164_12300 [Gemmatimonadales bacterium]|nr:hypothetical protein [Gemmatimonadales bacterium]MYG50113.1 hypothetical protein [Gemmatimonadales bacterium]MYK02327.1 hypothetical protein [Candidatus Palauibacter ramosifaciens]